MKERKKEREGGGGREREGERERKKEREREEEKEGKEGRRMGKIVQISKEKRNTCIGYMYIYVFSAYSNYLK